MNIFIFQNIEQVSDSYHTEGGAVIVANNKRHAIKLIEKLNAADKHSNLAVTEGEWEEVVKYPTADNAMPMVYVFPDAGCR